MGRGGVGGGLLTQRRIVANSRPCPPTAVPSFSSSPCFPADPRNSAFTARVAGTSPEDGYSDQKASKPIG